MTLTSETQPAKVFLVGAGPGHPGLITLRGIECLQRGDVILYDYLVNPAILRHARAGAELVCLGKHGRSRIWNQDEINAELVRLATAGKCVVRLKGGDPAVFARGAEEADTLRRHNIPFEIVPGITAALAAGSYAGIPITHRNIASAVALVTGQENDEKSETALDYGALANFPGTLVFYMGVTTVLKWSRALVAAGKSPETPVAVIRRCSHPDQWTLRCTLRDLTDPQSAAHKVRPPVLFILGDVVNLAPTLSWFDQRPLYGKKILVTRPLDQTDGLVQPLAELGADVLLQPAIQIAAPADWSQVDAAIQRLSDFDWIVFSSANGVNYFLERLLATGRDLRAFGNTRLAAIGPGTADALRHFHLQADLVPHEFQAESLAASLTEQAANQRFLLVRASRGRAVLAEEIQRAGGIVEQVVVYNSTDVSNADEQILELAKSGKLDWVTVTSSAIAKSLANMFGETLRKTRLASISPITSATLRELGFEPSVEATEYSMPGVVAAILAAKETV